MRLTATTDLGQLDFERADGLIPVVTQHARTGEVLMLAYANREALERTLETGEMWYWSRSRASLWQKGETSGNVQQLVSLHADCDADAVLAHVIPLGPSCHTGAWSCFEAPPTLPALARVLLDRGVERPEGSYTARLLSDQNLRLKKLGEEAVELALACARSEDVEDGVRDGCLDDDVEGVVSGPDGSEHGEAIGSARVAAEEAADLLYHALVAAHAAGAPPEAVLAALDRRLP